MEIRDTRVGFNADCVVGPYEFVKAADSTTKSIRCSKLVNRRDLRINTELGKVI